MLQAYPFLIEYLLGRFKILKRDGPAPQRQVLKDKQPYQKGIDMKTSAFCCSSFRKKLFRLMAVHDSSQYRFSLFIEETFRYCRRFTQRRSLCRSNRVRLIHGFFSFLSRPWKRRDGSGPFRPSTPVRLSFIYYCPWAFAIFLATSSVIRSSYPFTSSLPNSPTYSFQMPSNSAGLARTSFGKYLRCKSLFFCVKI